MCWQADAAARQAVLEAGYPEYKHASGHQVGRSAHNGGGILAPRWERYGQIPFRRVQQGNVFALELGIDKVDGHEYLGLEEMVVVTATGCEFLSHAQTILPILPY